MELEKRKLRLKTTTTSGIKSEPAAQPAPRHQRGRLVPAAADEGKLISVKRMELISFVDSIRWKRGKNHNPLSFVSTLLLEPAPAPAPALLLECNHPPVRPRPSPPARSSEV